MSHLIDKSALVAEIEKMLQEEYPCDNSEQTIGYHCALYELQGFLNTLEVKEVDLQSEIDRAWDNTSDNFSEDGWKEFEDIAKHFFELGFKAKDK